MSSVSPSRTRIDEAVARPRGTNNEWGAGCVVRQMLDLMYTYDYDEA